MLLDRSGTGKRIFLTDFGISKAHLKADGTPYPARQTNEFRGTIAYASLNAHNRMDLSRRDDLWSFYFMMLEFLGEQLPWKDAAIANKGIEAVKTLKERALRSPEDCLWRTTTKDMIGVKNIFYSLQGLTRYEDVPNYAEIRENIKLMINQEEATHCAPVILPTPGFSPMNISPMPRPSSPDTPKKTKEETVESPKLKEVPLMEISLSEILAPCPQPAKKQVVPPQKQVALLQAVPSLSCGPMDLLASPNLGLAISTVSQSASMRDMPALTKQDSLQDIAIPKPMRGIPPCLGKALHAEPCFAVNVDLDYYSKLYKTNGL